MNTASRTKISIPYRPAPTPPKTTSPSWMLTSGTMPPSGVKLSCIELTAPHDASVVTVANSAEADRPKRTSLPSMLPAATSPAGAAAAMAALGCDSAQYAVVTPPANRMNIAARRTQPWR